MTYTIDDHKHLALDAPMRHLFDTFSKEVLALAFRQVIWPHRSARILAPTRFSWLVCVEWWICWFVGGRTACRFR